MFRCRRAGAARARARFESAVRRLFSCMTIFLFLSTFDPLNVEQSFCLLTFLTSQYIYI